MKKKENLVILTNKIALVWQSATNPEVKLTHKWWFSSPAWELYSIIYGGLEFLVKPEMEYVWHEDPDTTPRSAELEQALADEKARKEIDTVLAYASYPTLDSCIMPVRNEGQLLPEWTDEAYFGRVSIWPKYRYSLGCGSGYVKENCRLVLKV